MKGINENRVMKNCYLIHGEEEWIKNDYIVSMKKKLLDESTMLMNYNLFEGKDTDVSDIIDMCETMPFFAEKKLVVVKNSGLFKPGRKEESEKLSNWISNVPEYVVLLFCEGEVDKRSKLYKQIKNQYETIEAGYPGDEEMMKILEQKQLGISKEVLRYFIQNMPQNITYTVNEFEKLLDYTRNKEVTKKAIDEVCVFSLEQRVFTLIKEVAQKDTTRALRIYKALIESKESPIGVLVLIARQYRVMMQIKYLVKGNISPKQIASQVGMPYFAVQEMVRQMEPFSFKQLEQILSMCLEADITIKTGKMDPNKCVELLIMQCIYI